MARSMKRKAKPKPKRELVSQREYARRRGVAHTTVQEHIRKGHLTTVGKDKRINPKVADRQWARNIDRSKPRNIITGRPKARRKKGEPPQPMDLDGAAKRGRGKGKGGGNGEDKSNGSAIANYSNARAAREVYLAQIAELDLRERQGLLVDAAEVTVAAFNAGRKVRDQLAAIPERVSTVLASMDDPHEVQRLLEDEIDQVCEELSGAKRS